MTPRQSATLAFIRAYIAEHDGVSPSYEEIAAALSLRSKSGAHGLVEGLIDRGYLRREGGNGFARCLIPTSGSPEAVGA